MSYNLYGWNALVQNPWKAENVYKAIRQINPDILGAQECDGMEQAVVDNLGLDYAVAGSANAGHAIIYRTTLFTLEGHGFVKLNEMDNFGSVSIIKSKVTSIIYVIIAENCRVCTPQPRSVWKTS